MSVEAAPAPAAPVKKTKVAKSPKKAAAGGAKKAPASHPTYSSMIRKAITELKEKGGSSKAAILKYIAQNYKLGDNVTKVCYFFVFTVVLLQALLV